MQYSLGWPSISRKTEEKLRAVGGVIDAEQVEVIPAILKLVIVPAKIYIRKDSVGQIEDDLRKMSQACVGECIYISNGKDNSGKIDPCTGQKRNGQETYFPGQEDGNRKYKDSQRYPEIAGQYIQIDLGSQRDKKAEYDRLLPVSLVCRVHDKPPVSSDS